MEASPFKKLPRELRDEIYVLALQMPGELHLYASEESSIKPDELQCWYMQADGRLLDHRGLSRQSLALTMVCKQLRHESLSVFYAVNRFCFNTEFLSDLYLGYHQRWPTPLGEMQTWLNDIGYEGNSALRQVNVDLSRLPVHKWHLERPKDEGFAFEVLIDTLNCARSEATIWTFSFTVPYAGSFGLFGALRLVNIAMAGGEQAIERAVGEEQESLCERGRWRNMSTFTKIRCQD